MEKRQHALRNIALKLNVSGTVEVLEEQRLYKGSYGFVKLQVYVPKTQNTAGPLLTAFCTTVDELGREVISSENHRLWYVDEYELGGFVYLLFESLLPREFTEKATQPDGLKITFNYCDSVPIYGDGGEPLLDTNGVPKRKATDVLISSRYVTTVYPGGWNEDSKELDINSAEAAQIGQNTRDIAELQADLHGFLNSVEEYRTDAEKAAEEAKKAQGAAETARQETLDAKAEVDKAKQATADAQKAAESARDTAGGFASDAQAAQRLAEQAANSINELNITTKEDAERAEKAREGAEQAASDAITTVERVQTEFESFREQLEGKADNLYFNPEDNKLYLMAGEEIIGDGVIVATGGGGGGGSGSLTYTITLKNLLPDRSFSISDSGDAVLRFSYASVDEDGMDDGAGVGTVTVGGVNVATISVAQGENSFDVREYLSNGSNTVRIRVENSEGMTKVLSYTITVIALTMSTTLDAFATYSGSVVFYYTPTGTGTKTVHFIMDGNEIGTQTVAASGRTQSFTIPEQSHGGHKFEAYAELTVNGVTVKSNTVTLGMIWVSQSTDPILQALCEVTKVTQGEVISISYFAYDPTSETAEVTLSIIEEGGETYFEQKLLVDRTEKVWNVENYPVGNVTFRIALGDVQEDIQIEVEDSGINIGHAEDDLVLYFDPSGRSNAEADPAQWTDGTTTATFENVGFTDADGWLNDADGNSILRLLPGGKVTLNYKLFAGDKRTNGVTVEVEMATHNVRDYDSIVMSCLSGSSGYERGFIIASQYAQIDSEQSSLSMQFREDERVRISFVVEPRNLNRLIYVYVNGIMCGAIQYPENDNFAQSTPVDLTIGAQSSGIDVYRVYYYDRGLTRGEVLANFIADRPTLRERMDAYVRNDILDESEDVTIPRLPVTVPYMIIACPALPDYKGDKKTCSITYVDQSDPTKSFTASGVEIDVQGTSSAGYKKKNFKIKLKEGLTYTSSGSKDDKYKLRSNSIPVSTFCMKADVASSESANNVELVRLYNDTCPYKTPPQEENPLVRVGIDGLPCVIFWQNTATRQTRFWGKYNFNNDKSTEEVYGLTEGCESWEILNNTSERALFKSSDFSTEEWKSDFEARYPDGSTDYTNLKKMMDWVVSTDRSKVSGEEQKAERLQKFKNEFEEHFVKGPMLYYYLFTEVFLMVDSRAKNFFPSTYDGTHWLPLPYDMDTAIGINNEGQLVFDYDLEDTDKVSGANVFNGQDSVLWSNIRDAFPDELKALYQQLRTQTVFSDEETVKRFDEHQKVWCEAIWDEDMYEKYIEPLVSDRDSSYLTMLQGNKASQREWWLFNGFRYRDSKYQTGNATSNYITLRCYNKGDITITPYSHLWAWIKYGSYNVTQRAKRNTQVTLVCPADQLSDTEVYIYSADRIAQIGDLSGLQVGYANFSMATKLQKLKLGDFSPEYENTHLNALYVGNNDLLNELDIQNCTALQMAVDLSGCAGLEKVYAKGSAIAGLNLSVGGKIKILELPDTVTNFTIRDQKELELVTFEGYDNIATLRVENTPNVPIEEIVNNSSALNRVRLVGVDWTATNEETLRATLTKLKSCGGLDATGDNADAPVVVGTVRVESLDSDDFFTEIANDFPDLVVIVNSVANYLVRYLNHDGTLLYSYRVTAGADAIDPVSQRLISAPTREQTPQEAEYGQKFTYAGFGTLPKNIRSNTTIVAQYTSSFRVRFYSGDVVFQETWVTEGGRVTLPSSEPKRDPDVQWTYTFDRWGDVPPRVFAPVDIQAIFTQEIRKYPVHFYNYDQLVKTVEEVPYGSDVQEADMPETPKILTRDNPDDFPFIGWSPEPKNIQGETSCYARYDMHRGTSDTPIYGVEWDNTTSREMRRTDDAVDLGFAIDPSTGQIVSDFDNLAPWNGEIVTDVYDNVFKKFPAHYMRVTYDKDGNLDSVAVSQGPVHGSDWVHVDEFWYAVYGASTSLQNAKELASISGVARKANTTRAGFRTAAAAIGAGYQQLDLKHKMITVFLWWIEYATKDADSIMKGRRSRSGTGKTEEACTTGNTDSIPTPSGYVLETEQMKWHNIEDFVGNYLEWIDGVTYAGTSGKIRVCDDPTKFSDSTSDANYKVPSYTIPSSTNYITAFGWDPDNPFMCYPTKTVSGENGFCDYCYPVSSSYPVVCSGAVWNGSSSYLGLVYFNGSSASYSYSDLGGRLLKIPL